MDLDFAPLFGVTSDSVRVNAYVISAGNSDDGPL